VSSLIKIKYFPILLLISLFLVVKINAFSPLYYLCDVQGVIVSNPTLRESEACRGDGGIPSDPNTQFTDCKDITLSDIKVVVMYSANNKEYEQTNQLRGYKSYCSKSFPVLSVETFSTTDQKIFIDFARGDVVFIKSAPGFMTESIEQSPNHFIILFARYVFPKIIIYTLIIAMLLFSIIKFVKHFRLRKKTNK
jgi:hypothetical protein